jgi:hypothetical protein
MQSNGTYGDVMPRVVGMFMLALGGLIFQFVRAQDYRYYLYSAFARTFIVLVLTTLYLRSHDPLFLVLDAYRLGRPAPIHLRGGHQDGSLWQPVNSILPTSATEKNRGQVWVANGVSPLF